MIKKIILIMLLGLAPILTAQSAFAGGGSTVVLPTDGVGIDTTTLNLQSVVDPLGVRNTTYFKICQIRLMFCTHHPLALVIIGAVIFAMGLLILTGKAKWQFILTTAIGMVIFTSAEYLVVMFTSPPPGLGVLWACTCIM